MNEVEKQRKAKELWKHWLILASIQFENFQNFIDLLMQDVEFEEEELLESEQQKETTEK